MIGTSHYEVKKNFIMRRRTKQGEAISRVLENCRAPLSAVEILARAKVLAPEMGVATVYRHLNRWLQEGKLTPVEFAGETCRYETTGRAHHHHFLCRECGEVFELPGCVDGLHSIVPAGFVPRQHEITIYGACPHCANQPENTHAD